MSCDRAYRWTAATLGGMALLCTAVPSFAWITLDKGKHENNVLRWQYNPSFEPPAVAGGSKLGGIPVAILRGAATWTDDKDNSFEDEPLGFVVDEVADRCGRDLKDATGMPGADGIIESMNRDGKNVVGWDNLPSDVLAYTWVLPHDLGDPKQGFIKEVDICFNTNPTLNWQPGPALARALAGQQDLQSVAVHEFGHAIGLGHPYEVDPETEYAKTVMYGVFPSGVNVRDLFCDDQSGADFIYTPGPPKHPDEPGETEERNYRLRHTGGCDFGDAPDPFPFFGFYPSLEGPFSPPLSVPPVPVDARAPNLRNLITGLGDDVVLAPILPGARHKDCTMEWLGPIPPGYPFKRRPIGASSRVRCKSQELPVDPSVSFEPESRQVDRDELDDGVSVVQIGIDRFLVRVFVNTSGLGAGRYDAVDANQNLYLNGWEDWNCDGDWDDPGEFPDPIFGIFWQGTPDADVSFSMTFVPPGQQIGNGRLLTFDVTAPLGFELPCAERFRLDYAEDAGLRTRPWSKESKLSQSGVGFLPEAPDLTRGTLKYGEVEDYTFGDHYLCYAARDQVPRRLPVVNLFDQFFGAAYRVKPPSFFCTPASKNRRPVIDPVTHLKGYRIAKLAGEHRQPLVDVHNQFGTLRLHAIKERVLFVPSAKKLDGPASSPDPNQPGFEHYKCYKVTTRAKLPEDIIVEVSDQFGPGKYTLQRPRLLCNPSEKRTVGGPVEPINNPLRHLVCYGIKPISAIAPPREVFANNQFGEERLRMGSEKLLCVPSLKMVVP